jgi:hypothetical protein
MTVGAKYEDSSQAVLRIRDIFVRIRIDLRIRTVQSTVVYLKHVLKHKEAKLIIIRVFIFLFFVVQGTGPLKKKPFCHPDIFVNFVDEI